MGLIQLAYSNIVKEAKTYLSEGDQEDTEKFLAHPLQARNFTKITVRVICNFGAKN